MSHIHHWLHNKYSCDLRCVVYRHYLDLYPQEVQLHPCNLHKLRTLPRNTSVTLTVSSMSEITSEQLHLHLGNVPERPTYKTWRNKATYRNARKPVPNASNAHMSWDLEGFGAIPLDTSWYLKYTMPVTISPWANCCLCADVSLRHPLAEPAKRKLLLWAPPSHQHLVLSPNYQSN